MANFLGPQANAMARLLRQVRVPPSVPRAETADWPALDLLKKSAEASVAVAAFLFVIGWSYLYGYYKALGIPTTMVSATAQEAIVHSFRAIFSGWAAASGYIAGAAVAALLLTLLLRNSTVRKPLHAFVVFIIYVGLFWLASYSAASIGATRARAQVALGNPEFPWIQVDVDRTKVSQALMDTTGLLKGDFKLALYQADRIWVVKPMPSGSMEQFPVLMIPKEAIRGMIVQRSAR